MKGGVLALGNFDGVHRGHQAVLAETIAKAKEMRVPSRVLTFEPHPRAFFQPDISPFRLTPAPVRERLLKELGIDDVVTLPFDAALANLSAKDFVEKILVEKFGAQFLVAGHDFVFGKNRSGDMKKMAEWLGGHNVGVKEVGCQSKNGIAYSSSRVRELLKEGKVEDAAQVLGRNWFITGNVVRDRGLGREIGIPTANIPLNGYVRPKFGVYAIRAHKIGSNIVYVGVANIGIRPTVNGHDECLEAHLFDFDRDIYGEEWEFDLIHFLRPERKFDSIEALKSQIAQDIKQAKNSQIPAL